MATRLQSFTLILKSDAQIPYPWNPVFSEVPKLMIGLLPS